MTLILKYLCNFFIIYNKFQRFQPYVCLEIYEIHSLLPSINNIHQGYCLTMILKDKRFKKTKAPIGILKCIFCTNRRWGSHDQLSQI